MVKLSVIVPCYNVEEYLSECLDSILNQTFEDIEIICINDGSTDNTQDILDSYLKKDNRIKVISQHNQGLSMARNVGLKNVTGEYVTFIDSDDYFELTAFEETLKIVEEKSLDLLIFKLINFDADTYEKQEKDYYEMTCIKEIIEDKVFNQEDIGEKFYYMPVTAPGKIYRYDMIRDMEFPIGMIFEDNPFFVEVMFRAKRAYFYDKHLYLRRVRSDSITNSAYSKFYHMIRIHNMIIDITRKYGFFEKYETRLYRRKISQIHWYFTLIDNAEDKEFYYQKMKADYKECADEYKSSEAFYKLPRRLQNFFNFALEYESHEEYQLKTENYDLFYSNYDIAKENRKLKREINSLKDLNRSLLNSKSWKMTEPLRKLNGNGGLKNG